MAKILSVHPVKWEGMKNHWWQFVSVPLLSRFVGNSVALLRHTQKRPGC